MRSLLPLVFLLGCAAPLEPEAPPPTPSNPEHAFHSARQALHEAGITELRFGLTPYVDGDQLRTFYRPVADVLQAALEVPVTLVVGTSYADMQERAVTADVDLAVLPPYNYVQARRREPGLLAFATHVFAGSPTYGAYIIALEDGPVRELTDIRGRSFGYVDPDSTSGFLFPADRMLSAGVHPRDDVEEVFLGGHDRVFDAVSSGELAAGAVYAGALASGRLRYSDSHVRVVAKTRRIPCDAYVSRAGLPPEVSVAAAVAFEGISTRTAEGRERLAPALEVNGFLPVEDDWYDVVREVDQRVREALDAPR